MSRPSVGVAIVGNAALVGLTMATLIACTAPRDRSDQLPLSTDAGQSSPLSGKTLPVDYVIYSTSSVRRVLANAVDRLVADCMKESGFDFDKYPDDSEVSGFDLTFRYGFVDPEAAATDGYPAFGENLARSAARDAVDERRRARGIDYELRLHGEGETPPVACTPLAQLEVFGVVGGFESMPGFSSLADVQSNSGAELYATEPGLTIVQGWSLCMGKAGFDFSSWQEARSPFIQRGIDRANGDIVPASDAELRQAKADAICRSSMAFESKLFEAEATIERRMLEERSAEVAAFEAGIQAVETRAKSILDGRHGQSQ